MSLRELQGIQAVYVLPRDSLVTGVLIPCLARTDEFRCMVGFFNSGALRDIAPGLAHFLEHSKDSSMRLLISPHVSTNDQDAIREGLTTPADVLAQRLEELVGEARVSERALVRHTLACLSYLIAADRLQIKITLIRGGLFHPKVWIFRTGSDLLVAHGSSNMTAPGLSLNLEHITIARSWADSSQQEIAEVLSEEFDALWQGRRDYAVTIDLPRALKDDILTNYQPDEAPTPADLWGSWKADYERGFASEPPMQPPAPASFVPPEKPHFEVPAGLNFETGDFAHQGKALRAWEEAGRRGILEMATGAGKTVTALIAARRLHDKDRPLMIVVAAPYMPLIHQWAEEARAFGLQPTMPGEAGSKAAKFARIEEVVRRLNLGLSTVECLVVTHDLLCDTEFQQNLRKTSAEIFLIGDEVHNLGRVSFVGDPPTFISHRMGLSATPERQYDEEGTAALIEYFGDVVFRFTLADAIGTCLVPYDYYVHPVTLETSEHEEWLQLTEQLRRAGWASGDDDVGISDRARVLLIRRRRILEEATGKISALRPLLERIGPRAIHHALIYATDKGPDQLVQVNAVLSDLGIMYHQVTAEETAQPHLAGQILESFTRGELQVLTAKRVLDEGVNIPEIATAFILASTTVERQWVQRRGRVLRKCEAIGKKKATIHDFLVLPPTDTLGHDREARKLVSQELHRVMEFARLAENAAAPGGPLQTVQPLLSRYFVRAPSDTTQEV